jgi:rhamnulokinase
VGGGIKNELLCQFTADAIGRKVVAGPVEGTAIGNVLMQAKATGQVKDLWEARKLVRKYFEAKKYEPKDIDAWQRQYEKCMK